MSTNPSTDPGPGNSPVSRNWIIGFTFAWVTIISLLFWGFVGIWPSCDVAATHSVTTPPSQPKPAMPIWISPQSGGTSGNESVTIIGTGLAKLTSVTFGMANAKITGRTEDTVITVTSPPHVPGRVDVVLAGSGGLISTVTGGFTYAGPQPTIASVSPSAISVAGGLVAIKGTGFLPAATVSFGGITSPANVESPTLISVKAPAHEPGAAEVAVNNGDGQRAEKVDALRYNCPAPSGRSLFFIVLITGAIGGALHSLRSFGWYVGQRELFWSWIPSYFLLPFVGATLGLIFYLMIGSGFLTTNGGDTPLVIIAVTALVGMFSPQAVQKLKEISEVVLTKPPQGKNTAAPAASPPSPSAPVPTITSITPAAGSTAGGDTVTIQGTGFVANANVTFGGVRATNIVVNSGTSVSAKTPAHAAGAVEVVLTNVDNQSATKPAGYTYQ